MALPGMPPLLGPAGHRHTANVPSENIFNTSNVPSENIFNTAAVPSKNMQPRVSTQSQPQHTKCLVLELDQPKPLRLYPIRAGLFERILRPWGHICPPLYFGFGLG